MRGSRNNRKGIGAYLLDLFIIVVGISISFILNEWREGRAIDEQKDQLILDIQDDLYADSIYFGKLTNGYVMMKRSHDSLLINRNRQFDGDSLTVFLDHFTTYFPFHERTRSYSILANNDQLRIEPEDTAIRMFLNVHNYVYTTLKEVQDIEKDFILKTATPYVDKHSSFISKDGTNSQYEGEAFYELREKDEFLNYLQTGQSHKQMIIDVLGEGTEYIKSAKAVVNRKAATIRKNRE